jgi:hypothetical protein
MAALTASMAIRWRGEIQHSPPYKVAAATTIYKGATVAVDTNGYAVPASDAAARKVVGIAREEVDNAAGAAGDKSVACSTGEVYRNNGGGTPVAQTHVGDLCYVVDDNIVSAATGTNSVVFGQVTAVDADGGVWATVTQKGVN